MEADGEEGGGRRGGGGVEEGGGVESNRILNNNTWQYSIDLLLLDIGYRSNGYITTMLTATQLTGNFGHFV